MSNETPKSETPGVAAAGLNLEIYEPTIRIKTNSIFGEREEMVPHTILEKMGIPVVAAWLTDNELQEMTVCSANIGFVKTLRKFYKGKLPPT